MGRPSSTPSQGFTRGGRTARPPPLFEHFRRTEPAPAARARRAIHDVERPRRDAQSSGDVLGLTCGAGFRRAELYEPAEQALMPLGARRGTCLLLRSARVFYGAARASRRRGTRRAPPLAVPTAGRRRAARSSPRFRTGPTVGLPRRLWYGLCDRMLTPHSLRGELPASCLRLPSPTHALRLCARRASDSRGRRVMTRGGRERSCERRVAVGDGRARCGDNRVRARRAKRVGRAMEEL